MCAHWYGPTPFVRRALLYLIIIDCVARFPTRAAGLPSVATPILYLHAILFVYPICLCTRRDYSVLLFGSPVHYSSERMPSPHSAACYYSTCWDITDTSPNLLPHLPDSWVRYYLIPFCSLPNLGQ